VVAIGLRSSRGVALALVASLTVPATLLAAPAAAGRAPRVPVPVLRWEPCGPEFPGAECALATVPLDYDRPNRGTTEIALARIPAADQENRIGTVFVNPGGPGGSGVDLVLDEFGAFLAAQLQGRFDVVGFDPRGVGASDPLHCFDSEDELIAFLESQPVFPYRHDQYRPFFDAYDALGAECLDDERRIGAHMNTADVARDLDLLRRAVGDRKLTYLGFSYGSYIGNTYANLFPRKVRALVIDGVLDPRLWSSGWQIRSDRVATQEVLDEFSASATRPVTTAPSPRPADRGPAGARWPERCAANQSCFPTASCTPTTSSSPTWPWRCTCPRRGVARRAPARSSTSSPTPCSATRARRRRRRRCAVP
jgi:pimeloyl-ACP methyl ester carboxylesterase